ncbi:hypothetical protein N0V90_000973 [Kalmusia sp. IMI 367209]|nr:hypothetical protein N0V90_000973 [Kalmusia sp. IMI 367209]
MSFLRSSVVARSAAFRPAFSVAPRAQFQLRRATQDYGSGDGNPAGEKPQQQGKNERGDLEHPGPPPPKVAQGHKSSSDSTSQSSSSGSGSGEASKKSSEGKGGSGSGSGKSVKGAQPKILSDNPPAADSEDVKQHNREMDQRAEKAHEQVSNEDAKNDKVPKGFWKGHAGADKEP